MLKIGKLTDYAMLIMSQMARDPASTISAASLAEALHLTTPTVAKILKMLSDADLVTSLRGAVGGYRLARAAETITVADIISAMEGDLALTECCENVSHCFITSMCTMRENWRKINRTVYEMLAKLTILDMLEPLKLQVPHHGK